MIILFNHQKKGMNIKWIYLFKLTFVGTPKHGTAAEEQRRRILCFNSIKKTHPGSSAATAMSFQSEPSISESAGNQWMWWNGPPAEKESAIQTIT